MRNTIIRLLLRLLGEPQIHYRQLQGSQRIHLHGDGITPGWYRLERADKVKS